MNTLTDTTIRNLENLDKKNNPSVDLSQLFKNADE